MGEIEHSGGGDGDDYGQHIDRENERDRAEDSWRAEAAPVPQGELT